MRVPSHITRADSRRDATMTPMIDVVFLLLIFFLCTASFQIHEQVLPSDLRFERSEGDRAGELAQPLVDLERVIVKISWADGRPAWEVNRRPQASWSDLVEVLAAAAAVEPDLPILLDPANAVPLGHVIEVYDLSRGLGFTTIQFAAAREIPPG